MQQLVLDGNKWLALATPEREKPKKKMIVKQQVRECTIWVPFDEFS